MSPVKNKPRVALNKRLNARAQPRATTEEALADPRTVGGRLLICRQARGIKQAAAAKLIKITPQSLGQLEKGDSTQPAAGTLLQMRDKLGYNPDYIIRGQGMPLLPNFEDLAQEMALLALFRELRPEIRNEMMRMALGLRRAQGGASASDPYRVDPPGGDDD